MQLQNQGAYGLELDSAIRNQLYGAIHQNLGIWWVLTGVLYRWICPNAFIYEQTSPERLE